MPWEYRIYKIKHCPLINAAEGSKITMNKCHPWINDTPNGEEKWLKWWKGQGGGDSAYERGGEDRRKFWIKPLKETDLGLAQAFFDP